MVRGRPRKIRYFLRYEGYFCEKVIEIRGIKKFILLALLRLSCTDANSQVYEEGDNGSGPQSSDNQTSATSGTSMRLAFA